LGIFVVLATVFLGGVGILFSAIQSQTLAGAITSMMASIPSEGPAPYVALAVILLLAIVVVALSRVATAWIRAEHPNRKPPALTKD
jgi:hypothetical protein